MTQSLTGPGTAVSKPTRPPGLTARLSWQVAEAVRRLARAGPGLDADMGVEPEEAGAEPERKGAIVFNATSEFCRTLGEIPTYGLAGNREDPQDLLVSLGGGQGLRVGSEGHPGGCRPGVKGISCAGFGEQGSIASCHAPCCGYAGHLCIVGNL